LATASCVAGIHAGVSILALTGYINANAFKIYEQKPP
jgi:hypothetical protein